MTTTNRTKPLLTIAAVATAMFGLAATSANGQLIDNSGITAIGRSAAGGDRDPIHAVDGSGLTFTGAVGEENDPTKYEHLSPSTADADGPGDGGLGRHRNWVRRVPLLPGWLIVDLGAVYALDQVSFFNLTASNATHTDRGVGTANVWYRTTAEANNTAEGTLDFDSTEYTQLGTTETFTKAPGGTTAQTVPDTIAFGGAHARYVAIEILTNQGDDTWVGIGELQFFGSTPAPAVFLSPTTVNENVTAGELVGTLSMLATGGDFTYALPVGVLDNNSFTLSGPNNSNVLTDAVFDFETKSSYDIRVVATEDVGGADQVLTNTITVSVNDINEIPTAANKTVATTEDTSYVFSTNDFNFVDVDDGDTLDKVQVTTLETAGALEFLSGTWGDVTLDQDISAADIDGSKLRFVPATNAYGTAHDTFEFKVHDGTVYSEAAYTMQVDVTQANDDPPVLIVNAEVGVGGTAVATLESKSEGTGLAYTISGGADRGLFDLTAGSLTKILAPVTAEVGTVYEVEVQATDSFGSNKVLIEVTVISGTSPGTVFRFK